MKKILAVALVAGLTSIAMGDIVKFDSQTDFLSATGAAKVADFDNVGPPGTFNTDYGAYDMGTSAPLLVE